MQSPFNSRNSRAALQIGRSAEILRIEFFGLGVSARSAAVCEEFLGAGRARVLSRFPSPIVLVPQSEQNEYAVTSADIDIAVLRD